MYWLTGRLYRIFLIGLCVLGIWSGLADAASAQNADTVATKARLYAIDSGREELLYDFSADLTTEGNSSVLKTRYTDRKWDEGKLAVSETLVRKDGRIVRYEIVQHQTDERGLIEYIDGKLRFSHTNRGTTSTDTHNHTDDFVVGHMLTDYMIKNWQRVLAGDTITVQYGVWNRRRPIRFRFRKSIERKEDGRDVVVVRFEAKNLGIRLLMGSYINFNFQKSPLRLLSIQGRTLPRLKRWGRWKNLNADMVFSYD